MTEPQTLLDVIVETLETIERFKVSRDVTPNAILEAMERRICIMLKKMIATPSSTSYCIYKPHVYSTISDRIVGGVTVCEGV